MSYFLLVLGMALITLWTTEIFFESKKHKKWKVIVVSFLMILSGFIGYYEQHSPKSYTDSFYFYLNAPEFIKLSSEDEFLDYGELRFVRFLTSHFIQTWLPNIKRTRHTEYILPNIATPSDYIQSNEIKKMFPHNRFIQLSNFDGFRIAVPPGMKITHDTGMFIELKKKLITFENQFARLQFELIFLSPDKALHGDVIYQEKYRIIFDSRLRDEYFNWFRSFIQELQKIDIRDQDFEALLSEIKKG